MGNAMAVHSLSGLKLDFLDNSKRGQGRSVYRHAYSCDTPPKRGSVASPAVMNDIGEFVAMAGKDPEVISSRSQLKAYEQKYGVKQCGFDQGNIVAENEAKWERIRQNAKLERGWCEPTVKPD